MSRFKHSLLYIVEFIFVWFFLLNLFFYIPKNIYRFIVWSPIIFMFMFVVFVSVKIIISVYQIAECPDEKKNIENDIQRAKKGLSKKGIYY